MSTSTDSKCDTEECETESRVSGKCPSPGGRKVHHKQDIDQQVWVIEGMEGGMELIYWCQCRKNLQMAISKYLTVFD
jgi:hypothetical protein